MKSLYKHLLYAGLLVSSVSCNYLDVVPDNVATLDHAFSDRYTAEKYLSTCYYGLPKSSGWNENPAMLGSGEAMFNKENQDAQSLKICMGLNSASSPLVNYWSGTGWLTNCYAGIRNCNIFLDNINKVKDLQTYEKNRMIAEVKFIKAYQHFYLLRYYGPMCPLRENIAVNESTVGIRVYREKVDDCFQYIVDLLQEVIDSEALPKIIEKKATELGRITRPAAYALKARVLMFWASPLFNGNTDYNSFLNENGEPFFNQTYDPNRWVTAADACKEAIEECEDAGIRLYQKEDYITSKDVSDSTRIVCALRNSVSERWNPELVWGLTTYPIDWSNVQSPALPRLQQATSASASGIYAITLNTVEKFYTKNGIPIDEDKTWDYSKRYEVRTGDETHKYYIQKGEETAALNFDREARFYSSLGFDRGKWYGNGQEPEDDADVWYPKNRFGEYSSVFNPGQYNATGYWPKKLIPMTTVWRDANSVTAESCPFPEIRFADLLLYYSEALNEIKEVPDDEVYKYIDMVRNRAGLDGVKESWAKYSSNPNKPLTKAGMREIIQQERAIELCCESAHFWDSRRWKTAQREQNQILKGWNVLTKDLLDYYTVTPIYIQKFTYRDYLAPIPESDITKNPLLIQNPGW